MNIVELIALVCVTILGVVIGYLVGDYYDNAAAGVGLGLVVGLGLSAIGILYFRQ